MVRFLGLWRLHAHVRYVIPNGNLVFCADSFQTKRVMSGVTMSVDMPGITASLVPTSGSGCLSSGLAAPTSSVSPLP